MTQNDHTNLLMSLAQVMAGDFSNHQQAKEDPKNFAHIRIFFRPLPFEFFNAIGFYSEQSYDYDIWNPYRQGIHQLIDQGEQIYVENYGLKEAFRYAGAGHNLEILKTISPENIQRRCNCSMIFRKQENYFRGEVEGKKCFIPRNGRQTYLISEVEITENTWVSLDRGMDINTNEQVWGSAVGPLKFEKRASFAQELPQFIK
ncbi:chorismate-binding protein [Aphanothece hegewaldii CCALA 016]|uniref:Chromophore lyase CpcT/CpeT n=1 Tax=Aphanothece hegewaldii CCALA 016 TaxID=2107694 RepID=A0A2T1LXP1_9CHRO|nr:chromophore lyase CpcT/CpeT [Aphanothece hegewaldii]PSF37157.1 chorismate-binding protein [Aphanothece hegewaldii CCALA 016]